MFFSEVLLATQATYIQHARLQVHDNLHLTEKYAFEECLNLLNMGEFMEEDEAALPMTLLLHSQALLLTIEEPK